MEYFYMTIETVLSPPHAVHTRSRSLYAVAHPSVICLSVVCNVRAP